jgi:serine/threonine-protein kinase
VSDDIFAAAVVGWELLTGRPLFESERSFGGIFRAPPPPSSINAAVPACVDELVMRGLSAQARDRFASAREMLEALAAADPLAPPAEIGAWIAKVGFAEVSRRDAIVTTAAQDAIDESPRSSVRPMAPAMPPMRERVQTLIGLGGGDDEPIEDLPLESSIRPKMPSIPEPELRPSRTWVLLLGVLILVLTVMALVLSR